MIPHVWFSVLFVYFVSFYTIAFPTSFSLGSCKLQGSQLHAGAVYH